MKIEIKKIIMHNIWSAPNCADLLAEYASESAIEGLPTPEAKKDLYHKLEGTGFLHAFGAYLEGTLIGFIVLLTTPATHYDITLFTSESFFVLKAHRITGAGLKLLHTAENFVKEQNGCGLLVSAPSGGSLADVLERTEYSETSRVFFKRLA